MPSWAAFARAVLLEFWFCYNRSWWTGWGLDPSFAGGNPANVSRPGPAVAVFDSFMLSCTPSPFRAVVSGYRTFSDPTAAPAAAVSFQEIARAEFCGPFPRLFRGYSAVDFGETLIQKMFLVIISRKQPPISRVFRLSQLRFWAAFDAAAQRPNAISTH
jgi:hypothetical protein